ncbi:MAG: sulfite dehydrogenase [Gemmatimonadota bacterium]|nr:sulfite dehydrogenase [Gemmatimonadota bacterium]
MIPPESDSISRRAWIGTTAGLAAGILVHHQVDAQVSDGSSSPGGPEPTSLGRLPSELGSRAPREQPRRRVYRNAHSGGSGTPLQDLHGIITPADLHFERHHGGVPDIDPDTYSLTIHGLVRRPTTFSLADLKRFPARSRICFLECSGNGNGTYRTEGVRRETTVQSADGLFSTSEWTGVPLSTLFREVGVDSGATWFLAEGADAAHLARSIPVEKAWDDAMIVYAQNGEAIRPEQGYPARLLLPGWEGNANVKWIRRIELSDAPFMTREETSKYTDPLQDGTARQFSFVMDAKSVITFPSYPYVLPEPGWWEVSGLAWSGRGRITGVEVSSDGGASWHDAELEEPVLPKCATRFRALWNWTGEPAVLMSRARDETGYVQPTLARLVEARGAGSSYHANQIRAWSVEPDGRVFFGDGK